MNILRSGLRGAIATAFVSSLSAPALGATGDPALINEVLASHTGTDTTEFVELYGTPGASLAGLSLIVVEGDVAGQGTIDRRIDFGAGDAIGGNGYFLIGNPAGLAAVYGVTPNLAIANDFLENSSLTVALVQTATLSGPAVTGGETVADAVALTDGGAGDAAFFSAPVIGPDGTFFPAGARRVTDGFDTDAASDWAISDFNLGPANTPVAGTAPPPPGPALVRIHEVQGTGSSVALTSRVAVEAVVVADYQRTDQLRGFFLQEEDVHVDGNPATSEGIFVFCGTACPATDVAVGDLVRVTGTPGEFFNMSQISAVGAGDSVSIQSRGNPLPTPAAIDLPAPGSTRNAATFEPVEGMLVRFTDPLVVSEYFELARYGQLVLTADARPAQFTDANEPSVAGYAAFLGDLSSRRIILDDDNNIQNDALGSTPADDEPYFWPRPGLSNSSLLRGGDRITNLTGVMHWSFAGQSGTDAWRVRPVDEAFSYAFTRGNPRPAAPEPVGGSMKVASFNVLNYFTTINARGADSIAELDRQRAKIAAAICAMDADVVGLIEIENNGTIALGDLLDGPGGVNARCGPYSDVETGVIGPDQIAVAFIYRSASANPVGAFATLDSSVDPRFLESRNRPALAQTFEETATGARITVVVNHLKSKGSDCNDLGDPDVLDGQGNCNVTRAQAAAALVDWLAKDPTRSGDTDVLVIGDLNAYRNEDPIATIEAGADDNVGTGDDYTDLLDYLLGPTAYSYVFDGQLGYLDHALASASLLPQVTGVTVWHTNADEIPVFDYNDDIRDAGEASFERESTSLPIYEPNAFRSSDHDAVIVGLEFDSDRDGVLDGNDACPATVLPEGVPTVELRANRYALLDTDSRFDTAGSARETFTLIDTAGCSCEQIIERTGLGEGHAKFGCSVGVMKDWVEQVGD
jgi:predicted extracellular nuclease